VRESLQLTLFNSDAQLFLRFSSTHTHTLAISQVKYCVVVTRFEMLIDASSTVAIRDCCSCCCCCCCWY